MQTYRFKQAKLNKGVRASVGCVPRTLQSTEHTGRVVDYTYDDLYRLMAEKVTQNDYVTGFSYQYDKVGNRTYETQFDGPTQVQTQYTYDDNDRLTKQGGVEYEYDKNGNTTRIAEEGNVVLYRYNGNDRLIEVTTEENGQVTSTVIYTYDADGKRIQTNADGEVTQYVVDSNDTLAQVIAELDANNQVNVAYLHGDDLISQYRGNEVNYYHYDGLGSTRSLTNSSSEVTDSYTYEAFGELQEQTGDTENNYLFTGEQLDPNTGNYYLRARYYNPNTGGFLSMDSFDGFDQDPITLHKYLYANGNPVNMVDPSGYFAFSLGNLSIGNTIRGILTTMNRVDKVLNILEVVTDPMGAVTDKLTDKAMGALVILGRLGKSTQKVFLRLVSRCRSKKKKNSFTAGTLVHTERGLVPIEEVRIGDFVLSYDEQTEQEQSNEVIHLVQGQQEYDLVTLTLENGETVEATAEHPFYVMEKGWQVAKDLTVGSLLTLMEGNVKVVTISKEQKTVVVYNFTVANAHTYYISNDGVLVHNADNDPDWLCDLNPNWSAHGNKHTPSKKIKWNQIVKGTKSGAAKYKPGINQKDFELEAWKTGIPVTTGKTWKVKEFPDIIGATEGKETYYVRIEYSKGAIHGHPITEKEFKKLTKPK